MEGSPKVLYNLIQIIVGRGSLPYKEIIIFKILYKYLHLNEFVFVTPITTATNANININNPYKI